MKAFAGRDTEAARCLWEKDTVIDRRSYVVRRDAMAILESAQAIPALQHDPHMMQRATCLLWIAHELERVANHCTNICERIVFIVQGETDIYPLREQ
jgi:phosphate transport system protein